MAINIGKERKRLIMEWIGKKPKLTPMIELDLTNSCHKILIKDEGKNSTETYKDKHGWMMGLDYLKNHFPEQFVYYLGSTGNAGLADFAFADELNRLIGEKRVMVANFYPMHYDGKILGPDSKGRFTDGRKFRECMEGFLSGRVIRVDFKKRYWFDDLDKGVTPCLDKMNELSVGEEIGISSITRFNSRDITEGFDPTYHQVMEEIAGQLKEKYGRIPRALMIVQFGAGMLYEDSKALARAKGLPIDLMAVSTGNRETIADKICDSSETWQENLRDLRCKGFTKSKKDGSRIYNVTEREILFALKTMGKHDIEAEASGAAGLAMALSDRLGDIVANDDNLGGLEDYELVVVINTGNGIKKITEI